MGVYEKILSQISICSRYFSLLFCFSIHEMVDSEYSSNLYTSLNISIATVMGNSKMLKFFPDHLKIH